MKLKGSTQGVNVLDVSKVSLHKVPVTSEGFGIMTDIGVNVKCKKDSIDTEFRCVFPETELMHFLDALYTVGTVTNLNEFKREMKWDDKPDWIPVSSTIATRNPLAGTFIDPMHMDIPDEGPVGQNGRSGATQYIIQQSAMRRAITKAMDQYDRATRKLQTIGRRGAFRWLPVAFSNDLVHGSWYAIALCCSIPRVF